MLGVNILESIGQDSEKCRLLCTYVCVQMIISYFYRTIEK